MAVNLAYKYEQEDLRHYEIWNGQVYYMAGAVPRHNKVAARISKIFDDFLEGKRCNVYSEGTCVRFEDEDTTVIPDVMVVCDPDKEGETEITGAPDLIVEVQSPSTRRSDRGRKMRLYERQGVREYWIVSVNEKTIEQYVLEDGKYALRGVYGVFAEHDLKDLSNPAAFDLVKEFKTTIFNDLVINVDRVFSVVE